MSNDNKYSNLRKLIDYWERFEGQQPQGSFTDFAAWLLRHASQDGSAALSASPSPAGAVRATEMQYETQVPTLIARLYRYARHYVKQSFGEAIPLTLEEFGFLVSVHALGRPTKSEVIIRNLSEITTGTEILSRLQRRGLLSELPHPYDRRSKMLLITPQGQELAQRAYRRILAVADFFLAGLDQPGQQQFLGLLFQLDSYLRPLYEDHREHTLPEVLQKYMQSNGTSHSPQTA